MAWFRKVALVACVVMVACEEGESTGSLPKCCGGLGTCLASALIPPADAAFFGRASCEAQKLCLPDDFVDLENFVPRSCRSTLGAEGRCFPRCLPDIARMADQLERGDCPGHHLCAPCYDLVSGESTGLCELGGDPGPTEPPVLFDECCHFQGRCLPERLVPEEERPRLGGDNCQGEGDLLCVPDPFLEEGHIPKDCHANLNAEGRCAPTCLPEMQDQADELPGDVCPAYYRCAPCCDPFTGDATGACALPNDPGPTEPKVVFEKCCESDGLDIGTCMPRDSLPADMADQLIVDACTAPDHLCAPDNVVLTPGTVGFPGCTTSGGEPGACVPACYLSWEEALIFPRASCGQGERCVSCYFAGQSTGVC